MWGATAGCVPGTDQTTHELNVTHPGQHGLTRPPTSSTWLTWGQHGLARPATSSTWLTRGQHRLTRPPTSWSSCAITCATRTTATAPDRCTTYSTCCGAAAGASSRRGRRRGDDVTRGWRHRRDVTRGRVRSSAAAPAPSLLWMLCFNSLNNCHTITIRTKLAIL